MLVYSTILVFFMSLALVYDSLMSKNGNTASDFDIFLTFEYAML